MIDGKEMLESRDRPVRPGDFLILVRHRDALVESLVRETEDTATCRWRATTACVWANSSRSWI